MAQPVQATTQRLRRLIARLPAPPRWLARRAAPVATLLLFGLGLSFVASANTAPNLVNLQATSPIDENGVASLTGQIVDPDLGDAHQVVVNWGDRSRPETFTLPPGTTMLDLTHRYRDDAPSRTSQDTFTITVRLTDLPPSGNANSSTPGRGVTITRTTQVLVKNKAPLLGNVQVTSPVTTKTNAILSGSISDASSLDSFVLMINWGDGSRIQKVTLRQGATSFSVRHRYKVPNSGMSTYPISVQLTDDDGGTTSASTSVRVNNP